MVTYCNHDYLMFIFPIEAPERIKKNKCKELQSIYIFIYY